MDRVHVERNFRQAEHRAALGRRHVARQREIVTTLEMDGHDVTRARALLSTYEEVQKAHEAECDRLWHDVAKAPDRPL